MLYALFGQCGKVIDVVVMKTEKLRGQAWIVFADITSATNALRTLNEFPLYGRPLVRKNHIPFVACDSCNNLQMSSLICVRLSLWSMHEAHAYDVYNWIYVCVCVCVCEREREREREREKLTERGRVCFEEVK